MALRVIQWATGSVGRASIECILAHPDLELVGCWVHSGEKAGRDVGELIGREPLGVVATDSLDEIVALQADAVMYAPLLPRGKEVAALLRSGKNVVTPVGWFYPAQSEIDRMNTSCEQGGVSLHGTGIDPGMITEVLPLILSSMSSGVTFVRGEEISDIRAYGSTDVVRDVMMFGATREQALNGPMLGLLDGGYTQSVTMMTDALGIHRDDLRIETVLEVAVATAPIESPIGVIEPGQVAGQRLYWDGYVGDRKVARVGVTWLMGQENLDPPWTFGERGERFDVEVRGTPDTDIAIETWHPESIEEGVAANPGLVATAAHCVNAIPYVCAAPTGVRTSLELPLIAGRAHASLVRSTS